jgi:predicted nucleotidyltransferase
MSDTTRRNHTVSGRFLLRLPPGLHARLREEAHAAGVSLNEFCTRRLAAALPAVSEPAAGVITRASEVVGRSLVGVVAFGSWVRGEAMTGSDVDVLVVVEPGSPITRALYRQWDAERLTWAGRPLDAHFVPLPETADRLSGLWAEAAVEGVVLTEREFRISAYLASVRRRIVAGEIVRAVVHGQPYWREVA